MAVVDRHVDRGAKVALVRVPFPRDNVPVSQNDVVLGAFKPGHRFQIEDVQIFCSAVAATASVDVKVGTQAGGRTSVLSATATPTAGQIVEPGLASALSARQGGGSDEITVHGTTDATGTIDDLLVVVTYRPVGLAGDAPVA